MAKDSSEIAGLNKKIIFGYIASTIFWNFYTSFHDLLLSPSINNLLKVIFKLDYEKKELNVKGLKFIGELIKFFTALFILFVAYKLVRL